MNCIVKQSNSKPQTWTDILVQRKWDMRFGMWNIRSLYRAGSLLRWIFRKWEVGHGMDRTGSGFGQAAGTCEWSNKPLDSIK